MDPSLRSQIRQAIEEVATNSATARGSTLGQELCRRHPDINLRVDVGGLANFIRSDCADLLTWEGKHGGDDLYRSVIFHDPGTASPSQVSPWTAFQDPRSRATLLWNTATGRLIVVSTGEAQDEAYKMIPSLTPSEHAGLIATFAKLAPRDIAARIDALGDNPLWSDFQAIVQHEEGLFRDWLTHRRTSIIGIFEARLTSLGATAAALPQLVAQLVDHPSRTTVPKLQPRAKHDAPAFDDYALAILRRLDRREIERIKVPLGLAYDCFIEAMRSPKR